MTASILAGPIIIIIERLLLVLLSSNNDDDDVAVRANAIKKTLSVLKGGKRVHLEPPEVLPVSPEQFFREMILTMS